MPHTPAPRQPRQSTKQRAAEPDVAETAATVAAPGAPTARTRKAARPSGSGRRRGITGLVVLAVVVAVGIVQATVLNEVLVLARQELAPLVVVLGALAWMAVRARRAGGRSLRHALAVPASVAVVLLTACGAFGSYLSQRAVLQSVQVTSSPTATYAVRAPFVVAKAQASGHMTTNGNLEDTNYVPALGHYGSLVAKRGPASGYEQVVWQVIGTSGQATSEDCAFTAKVPRFGGWFGANLTRAVIRRAGFGVVIDDSDAYGYCDAQHVAHVVVPVKKWAGFPFPHQVAGGVVVLDGDTGASRFLRTVTAGQVPGPVYPVSLAAAQARSTHVRDGLWSWVMSRAGWESTPDDDAVNAQNNAQFNLGVSGRQAEADFVSPLTLVGHSSAISAVGATSSASVTAGRLNPYAVHVLAAPRQSNSAVVARLKSDYDNLTAWATGMGVFEIAPTSNDHWVATLGQNQAISYVARINADSTSCLDDTSGHQLQCSNDQDAGQSQGGQATTPSGFDLTRLSNAELARLAQQVAQEMARRMR